ncbi:UDP-glycosyltransferase 708C1-like [Silene latifolia]|uniref:UDP-glycosyltransferase 708C1-like n=1 Tax=Silene latifolia TaxID=37657 RepID=UPI003D778040
MVTSARFFSLMVSLLDAPLVRGKDVILPGIKPIHADEPPPIMYNTEHAFVRLIIANAPHLLHAKGILVNTFENFESDTLSALRLGRVFKDLPPVFPIGPLHRLEMEKGSNYVAWLDKQPVKSVVFVSFGSRTAMGKDQIKELGDGLQRSGMRFLWVIKTTMVDKDDKEELTNLLGPTFFELTNNKGLILKEFVNQEEVLSHPSIGGFLTHSGWNSVLESAQLRIPLLAWPPGGDQRVNAAVMKDAGLGIWERHWGSENQGLIMAHDIKDKIMELMTSDKLRANVEKVAYEAKKAWEIDGSSSLMFNKIIDIISKTPKN